MCVNGKRGRAAALIAALLLFPAFAGATAPTGIPAEPRYVSELAARVPGVRGAILLAGKLADMYESWLPLWEDVSASWRYEPVVPRPDIAVRVLAERAVLAPGALCIMKLQVVNRGEAGAPLLLKAYIPDGFVEASAAVPAGARRAGRRLSWRVEAPPADEGGPAVIEVTYPLRAEALPPNVRHRAVVHSASYTVAEGAPQKAEPATTEISRPRPLVLFTGEEVLISVAGVLLLGTVAVFLLMLLHKEPNG